MIRSAEDANLSPRKYLKRTRPTPKDDAEAILETKVFKDMLQDHAGLLANLHAYVCELLDAEVKEKDPRELLKLLLEEGWVYENGMVSNMDNELTLLWKDVKTFKNNQSNNLVKNLDPDMSEVKLGEIKAADLKELVEKTNEALKISETAINKTITASNKTKAKTSTLEQNQIRAAMENEHLKVIANDLDLKDCNKTNAWDISAYAKDKMIKNYYEANKEAADKTVTSPKEMVENRYVLTNNLLVRMTVNAMGKKVTKNDKGLTTVALLLTFSSVSDKEAFRSVAKDCGVRTSPSVPKGYIEQKSMIMKLYRELLDKNGETHWVKVDVRPTRPEDPMGFTVQSKKAGAKDSRWTTAGKVQILFPQTWGRLNQEQRESYLQQSFNDF